MKMINITLPDENYIITRKNFIIDKLFPISISKYSKNLYIVLFIAHQNYDDSYIYIKYGITVEDDNESKFFDTHQLNGNIILNDKDVSKKDSYKSIIRLMNKGNTFGSDLNIIESKKFPFYFQSVAVNKIDSNHYEVLDIFYNTDNFIKLKLFIYWTFKLADNNIYMNLFSNESEYRNIEIVNIETVVMNCTKRDGNYYTSNYTMNCGPSTYNMNWKVKLAEESDKLYGLLDKSIYNSTYYNNFDVTETFSSDSFLYIIYKNEKGIKALRLNNDLSKRTNFIDKYNIFEK